MIFLLIYVALVALLAWLLRGYISRTDSPCTGDCCQGRNCSCRGNRDA